VGADAHLSEAVCRKEVVDDKRAAGKGPYREVLDWLAEQLERLDEHNRTLEARAAAGEVDDEVLGTQHDAVAEAREWLADQLAMALEARGMHAA
jgi:hypothetical protein